MCNSRYPYEILKDILGHVPNPLYKIAHTNWEEEVIKQMRKQKQNDKR